MTYPGLIMRSLELAAQWHENQWRRHPIEKIPYIAHPAGVGMLLMQCGMDDEVVSAGILHDVIEDCGITKELLMESTSARVAELVLEASEDKAEAYEERKKRYRDRLANISREGLLIITADHVHNLHALRESLEIASDSWNMFHLGKAYKIDHEEQVLRAVEKRLGRHPLVLEFKRVLEDVRKRP